MKAIKDKPRLAEAAKPEFVLAGTALSAAPFLNWDLRAAVELSGDMRVDAGGSLKRRATAWYPNGDVTEWWIDALYPLRVPTGDEAARIVERCAAAQARLANRAQASSYKGKASAGEVDETGATTKRAPSHRGAMDPKSGYAMGTDGHRFALIMLGEPDRTKAVAAIQKLLEERFDAKKARALAQSWHSTVIRKWRQLGRIK